MSGATTTPRSFARTGRGRAPALTPDRRPREARAACRTRWPSPGGSAGRATCARAARWARLNDPGHDRQDEAPPDDDHRERLLRLRADARRDRRREEPRRDERRHENGPEALDRRLARGILDAEPLHAPEPLEIGDNEDGVLGGDAENGHEPHRGRHREVHAVDEEREQAAGAGHGDVREDDERVEPVARGSVDEEGDEKQRERDDELEPLERLLELVDLPAPLEVGVVGEA